jgi:hypothetical protein
MLIIGKLALRSRYGNNCGCNEHQNVPSWGPAQTTGKLAFGKGPLTDGLYHYQNEVKATIDFGFDGTQLASLTCAIHQATTALCHRH